MTLSPRYAAGFFDGEGTVYIQVRHRTISRLAPAARQRQSRPTDYWEWTQKVAITNTHRGILEQFQQRFGGQVRSTDARTRPHRRAVFQWVVAARQAEACLRILLPHLVVKRPAADIFLRFRATIGPVGNTGQGRIMQATRRALISELRHVNRPAHR